MAPEIVDVTPVLRMFDVGLAKRFYVEYLGCALDWEEGSADDGPVYLQVSRGPLRITSRRTTTRGRLVASCWSKAAGSSSS